MPLEHLAGVALLSVVKEDLLMLMTLHKVAHAKSGSIAR